MEIETINGYVEKIIFRNEENAYTVVSLSVEGDEVMCTGYFADLTEKNLRLQWLWRNTLVQAL